MLFLPTVTNLKKSIGITSYFIYQDFWNNHELGILKNKMYLTSLSVYPSVSSSGAKLDKRRLINLYPIQALGLNIYWHNWSSQHWYKSLYQKLWFIRVTKNVYLSVCVYSENVYVIKCLFVRLCACLELNHFFVND